MRPQEFSEDSSTSGLLLSRKLWERLTPILSANRQRVGLALLCLLGAKAGLLCIPFLLKALVDGLDTNADYCKDHAIVHGYLKSDNKRHAALVSTGTFLMVAGKVTGLAGCSRRW